MLDVILKRFDKPDEIRTFPKGKFEIVHVAGMPIGRATCEPGWRWSEHVGGSRDCHVEHVGLVVSGKATAAMTDGTVYEMKPAIGSTFLPAMTVGSLATNPTSRFI
jgi:hypothetical protein